MSVQYYYARFKQSTDTHENWFESDPVLLYGELAIVRDASSSPSPQIKIGDGYTPYSDLPFLSLSDGIDVNDIGIPFGVVPLGEDGKVPNEYLSPTLPTPTMQSLPYTGEPQSCSLDTTNLLVGGTTVATEPGTYHVTARPVNATWEDGTQDTLTIPWSITR